MRDIRLINLTHGMQALATLKSGEEEGSGEVSIAFSKEIEGAVMTVTVRNVWLEEDGGWQEAQDAFLGKALEIERIEKLGTKVLLQFTDMIELIDHGPMRVRILSEGTQLIESERYRQIEMLGYDTENDKFYGSGELLDAAAAYLVDPEDRNAVTWPWTESSYNPTPDDRVLELTKAGALIAAEIDRLLLTKRK